MPKFNLPKTYLAVIKNSVGTKMFKDVFATKQNKKSVNITKAGKLSCAVFVSYVLKMFNLVNSGHATVDGLIIDLEKSGWQKITKAKIGAVIVWEAGDMSNNHAHMGFYIGNERAISNSSRYGCPKEHHWTYGVINKQPKRRIIAVYWHNSLNL